MRNLMAQLVWNEEGQDLIEYALLAAFIGLAGVGVFNVIAASMNASYSSWDTGINSLWQPGDPVVSP
jgi:Flp pilus assembly pilin Flp